TTTTTVPTTDCVSGPVGPTFFSINCRLVALGARVSTEVAADPPKSQLLDILGRAVDRTDMAQVLCGQSDTKHARGRLKQAAHTMTQFGHRLRIGAARKHIDRTLRATLIEQGDTIGDDLRALRGGIACPADASS